MQEDTGVFCIDIKFKTLQISLNMAVGKCKNIRV